MEIDQQIKEKKEPKKRVAVLEKEKGRRPLIERHN
jgi:hypothetical protein